MARLRPEPNAPSFTPLHLTAERFGRVPRYYIRCERDRAIGPGLQGRMVEASPCRQVFTLDTDHSPFYSAPMELAKILLAIMAETERTTTHQATGAGAT